MIDYYLHKKCPLVMATAKQIENVRCSGCVWLDQDLHLCIFGLKYPLTITLDDFKGRIHNVNVTQQANLSEPFRRFMDIKGGNQ